MPRSSKFAGSHLAEFWGFTTLLHKSKFLANSNAQERPLFLQNCTDQLYSFQRKFAGPSTFQLHDGPPYANGSLHIGHALNKITKDIICRYQVLQGTKVQYTPGWDCHGLPIELKALQTNVHHENTADQPLASAIATRTAARQLALAAIEEQKSTLQEWAIMADWKSAWTTMDEGFQTKQLEVLKTMVAKGLIHRRNKPVHWSPSSQTALAEAELQYREDHTSQAAYVAFPILTGPKRRGLDWTSVRALVWTTTPWTIPANQAIAVNPNMNYVIANIQGHGTLLMSQSLAWSLTANVRGLGAKLGLNTTRKTAVIKGSELVGATYKSPIYQEDAISRPILAADFVAEDTGTGLVHSAPGHGMDDYKLGQAHGLATFAPVDDQGRFTEDALPHDPQILQGKAVLEEGNEAVLSLLKDARAIIHTSSYTHKYPYDWRSNLPVIQRATPQWFADLTSIQEAAVSAIDRVKFVPQGGKDRLLSFVQNRAEWCLSRQRAWGVPFPALYKETGEAILTEASVAHIIETIRSRGIDAWWTDSVDDPAWIPDSLLGPNGENHFRRGLDTMDVWFDSGTSWTQIQNDHQSDSHPVADVYLEGSDQHRGWFQSSLLTYVAQYLQKSEDHLPSTPFKTLITHGFVLDDKGRKMSKSEGNVVTPQAIRTPDSLKGIGIRGAREEKFIDYGPDTLRLWVATSDYQKDVTVNFAGAQNNSRMMKKLRLTFRLLITLQLKSNPPIPLVFNHLSLVDRVALVQLRKMDEEVRSHYENYEFHKAMATINNYIRTDFSRFYIEAIKDRMYTDGAESSGRLQALAVLWEIFQRLIHRLAPIVPLLTEEASHYMVRETGRDCMPVPWKPADLDAHLAKWKDKQLEDHMVVLFAAKAAVNALQEKYGRKLGKMGSSLQSYVHIECHDVSLPTSLFGQYTEEELEAFFVVSRVYIKSKPPPKDDGQASAPNVSNPPILPRTTSDRDDQAPNHEWHKSTPLQVQVKDKSYDFTVHVCSPTDHKCVRCWRYVVEDEAAKALEEPLCQRCLGIWDKTAISWYLEKRNSYGPAWLEANIPKIAAATKALKEDLAKEEGGVSKARKEWMVFHWDAAYAKK